MNWYIKINIIGTITVLLFFYTVWMVIGHLCLILVGSSIQLTFDLYFIWLFVVLLMQYLQSKMEKGLFILGIPIIASIFLLYLKYHIGRNFINFNIAINFIIFTIILIAFRTMKLGNLTYQEYLMKIKQSYLVLVTLITTMPLIGVIRGEIIRFYVLYLAASVILLREQRLKHFGIHKKRNYVADVLIFITTLIFSKNKALFFIVQFYKAMVHYARLFIDNVLLYAMIIVGTPIALIADFLLRLFFGQPTGGGMEGLAGVMQGGNDAISKMKKLFSPKDPKFPFTKQLEIIIAVLIIWCLYKFFSKQKAKKAIGANQILDEREKIEKPKKNRNLFTGLQGLFKNEGIRESILSIYRRFEMRTDKKGIFERSMSAAELEKATKTKVIEKDAVHIVTKLYNEAKFSDHEMEESELKDMKEKYTVVKKEL